MCWQYAKEAAVLRGEQIKSHQTEPKAEFIAMRLALLAGLNVAPVKLINAAKNDVRVIERFDRQPKDSS